MQKLSHLPHVPLRRSHLDSGTYRNLVRILSHCIDDSLIHPPPPPPNSAPASDQTEEQKRLAVQEVPVADGNPNEVLSNNSRREEHDKATSGRLLKEVFCQNPRIHDAPDGTVGLVEERVPGKGREGDGECLVTELPKDEHPHFHLVGGLGRGEAEEGFRECTKNKLVGDVVNDTFLLVEEAGNVNGEQNGDECIHGMQQKEPHCENPTEVDDQDLIPRSVGKLDDIDKREGHNRCFGITLQNDIAPEDPQVPDCQHEAFSPVEELGHGEKNHGKSDESANNELVKDLIDENSKFVNAPSDIFCFVEESERVVLENKLISCNPNTDFSGLRNSGTPVSLSVGLINEREIEEGEISDDAGVLSQSSDSEFEHIVAQEGDLEEEALSYKGDTACMPGTFSMVEDFDAHIRTGRTAINEAGSILTVCGERDTWTNSSADNKLIKSQEKKEGGNAAKKYFEFGDVPDNLRLTAVFPGYISVANAGNQSSTMDVEFCEKKKRGPLTESRKEKKKLAKKRKRAEQNRKLGVKRLKLQPILKPKKVIYCNFYLKGRCQQGDLCKFSHDTTPLTKSQPCKYYASETCLKGEDCPFDHQLSNYPCHNYMSKGMCSRGDTCKFSHKMPIGEGSSAEYKISKPDSPVPLEKSSLGKRLNMDNTSPVINDPSGPAQSFTGHAHTAKSLLEKNLKPPARVPKGIRFLSFGNESLVGTDKQQIYVSSKKGGVIKTDCQLNKVESDNLQNSSAILAGLSGLGFSSRQPIKSLMDGYKNASSLVSNPLLQATYKSNILASRVIQVPPSNTFANKESKTGTCSSEPATTPYSGNLPNGLSDATKILEEFLFSGDI